MARPRVGRGHGRAICIVWTALLSMALAGCAAPPATSTPAPPAVKAHPPTPTAPRYFPYVVRKGDTLFSLGRRYGVTAQEIARDNDITSPEELAVGTLLIIRRVEGAEAPPPLSANPAAPPASSRPVSKAHLNRGKPNARFWWPTDGVLARRFGDKFRGFSEPGIAISAPAGTEVYAAGDGTVIACVRGGDAPESVWGNVVAIAHEGAMVSWYAHLANIVVREGARVSKGEPIGTVGSTGAAPSPMLAFRLFHNARPVDPLDYLP